MEQVDSFKFLGTYISEDLNWHMNSISIIKKARQRLYFLRTLKSFKVQQSILINFYRAIIESILTGSIIVWFGRVAQKDVKKMESIIRAAEKIVGCGLPSLQAIYNERALKRMTSIMKDQDHPANELFEFLPSKRRLRSFYGSKRFISSFYPSAVRAYNSS